MLISHISDDVMKDDQGVSVDHTHCWECRQKARTYSAAGFYADFVAFDDTSVRPREDEYVLASPRADLEMS